MAAQVDELIDCALEDIVNATNQSKHVKRELKKSIMETVSKIANIFYALKKGIVDKSAKTQNFRGYPSKARTTSLQRHA